MTYVLLLSSARHPNEVCKMQKMPEIDTVSIRQLIKAKEIRIFRSNWAKLNNESCCSDGAKAGTIITILHEESIAVMVKGTRSIYQVHTLAAEHYIRIIQTTWQRFMVFRVETQNVQR